MKSRRRDPFGWFVVAMFAVVAAWFVAGLALAVVDAVGESSEPTRSTPGPEWVHDRGSIWWTCTSDGHALVKDTDTGSTMLDRNDRKCDAGG